MSELKIPTVEKEDIVAPKIPVGGTAIVLERHGKYQRDRDAENAGSIYEDDAEVTKQRDLGFFAELLEHEDDGETMILFVSSDTQYAKAGRRSMETAQLAQDAAIEAMNARGLDPTERIINFNSKFNTSRFDQTDQDVRAMKGIVEPKIFDDSPEFVAELGRMFNPPEVQSDIDARRTDVKLHPAAFEAYESDLPEVQSLREKHGAEGVRDILDRTKASLRVLERYARLFHASNPNKKLVIWAASHYDTISPLVKDAFGAEFSEFVPVDYGAGVVMNIAPGSQEVVLSTREQEVVMNLGKRALQQPKL